MARLLPNLGTLFCATALCMSLPAHAAGTLSDGLSSVTIEDVRKELDGLPPHLRATMSKVQLTRFVSNILLDRRLADAAKAAGMLDQERIRTQIAKASRDILAQAYVDDQLAKAAEMLPNVEGLAKERYEAGKSAYVVPEAIRVAHILLRVDVEDPERSEDKVKEKINRLLAELKDGADFGKVAKENSEDTGSALKGGELAGWMDKGRLVPPFEAAAYALKPGELSAPVKTRFGYHIIKLIDHRNPSTRPFEEVKDQIVKGLRDDMLAQKRQEVLKPYMATQAIELDEESMAQLRKP